MKSDVDPLNGRLVDAMGSTEIVPLDLLPRLERSAGAGGSGVDAVGGRAARGVRPGCGAAG